MMKLKRAVLAVTTASLFSVGAVLVLASTAQAAPVATSGVAKPVTVSPAADGIWPAQVNGKPASLAAGAPLGYYIWHDNNGWHLEVTHPTHSHVTFSGWVSTDGTLRVQRVDDERNDVTKVGPDGHVLAFAFNNYGFIDGVHFETRGAQYLDFHLYVDGLPAHAVEVNIGGRSLHPEKVPFAIDRTAIR
jgi:hypothetical protein